MTQYKTVIVPTPCDDSGSAYSVAAEAITRAITEEAKDGWEVTLAQEMESGNKGLFANLFGSKKTQNHTLLVFKKEEEKPEPEPAKEFDYDRFEEIVTKGMDYDRFEEIVAKRMDYDRFAKVMKKVVSETEVTISKKSFAGLKFSLPTIGVGENGEQQIALLLDDKAASAAVAGALPNKEDESGEAGENNDKSFAIARVLYEIFKKNEGKGISFEDIMKESEGKLPEGTTADDVTAILKVLVSHNKVKTEEGLFSL